MTTRTSTEKKKSPVANQKQRLISRLPTYSLKMDTPETITCIECDGTAHPSSYAPHEGFESGDVVAYACEDCNHRLDLVLDDADDSGE